MYLNAVLQMARDGVFVIDAGRQGRRERVDLNRETHTIGFVTTVIDLSLLK